MAGGSGSSSGSFNWPPTASDLNGIDVVPIAAPPLSVAASAAPAGHPPLRRARGRPVQRLLRVDNLVLLAAGMLLGAALPDLGTTPPTRLAAVTASMPLAVVAPVTASPASATSAPDRRDTPAGQVTVTAIGHVTQAAAPVTTAAATVARKRRDLDPRTRQVLAVVRAYERAWTRMDAKATRAVWPEADVRSLTRNFTAIREQRLTLSGCRVRGSDDEATASCVGTLRYRPRKGDHSTRVQHGRWQFHVERSAQRWVITSVDRG